MHVIFHILFIFATLTYSFNCQGAGGGGGGEGGGGSAGDIIEFIFLICMYRNCRIPSSNFVKEIIFENLRNHKRRI